MVTAWSVKFTLSPLALERVGGWKSLAALEPFGGRAVLERANFTEMAAAAARCGVTGFRGILMDLGVSSMQLDEAARGFSFREEAPLDMRMDDRQELTAAELLRRLAPEELAQVLRRYGEEPMAKRIARAVGEALARGEPLETTTQLAALVERVKGGRRGRIGHHGHIIADERVAERPDVPCGAVLGMRAGLPTLRPGRRPCRGRW